MISLCYERDGRTLDQLSSTPSPPPQRHSLVKHQPDEPADDVRPSFTERFVVAVNYDGWRLDRYLTEKFRRASRAKVARIVRAGVRVGGRVRTKPGTTVRTGDVIEIDRVERADPATPSPDEVVVLFESATVVVVDKPAGLLVHRTAREATRTLDSFLSARFPDGRVEAAHRIDRDTSGLLACAADAETLRRLQAHFATGAPDKVYRALAVDPDSRWSPGDDRVFDEPLGFDRESAINVRIGRGAWPCRTFVTCVDRHDDVAALDVRIERGRQHQIRAHLSLFGTPLAGDKLYAMGDDFFGAWYADPGADELVARLASRWHCLHAWRMTLDVDGVERTFEAPLPRRMRLDA